MALLDVFLCLYLIDKYEWFSCSTEVHTFYRNHFIYVIVILVGIIAILSIFLTTLADIFFCNQFENETLLQTCHTIKIK